MVFNKD